MKKIIFMMVFAFLSSLSFAQTGEHVELLNDSVLTTEGVYAVNMYYEGTNIGQKIANEIGKNIPKVPSISKGQSQAIWNALRRYDLNTGDTFVFFLILNNNQSSNDNLTFSVIVEINEKEGFNYWAYKLGTF